MVDIRLGSKNNAIVLLLFYVFPVSILLYIIRILGLSSRQIHFYVFPDVCELFVR